MNKMTESCQKWPSVIQGSYGVDPEEKHKFLSPEYNTFP